MEGWGSPSFASGRSVGVGCWVRIKIKPEEKHLMLVIILWTTTKTHYELFLSGEKAGMGVGGEREDTLIHWGSSMTCGTMGLKSTAYIFMTKLTDLHCNAESRVIFQDLRQQAKVARQQRSEKGHCWALTCYLRNNRLWNSPVGQEGFDFFFDHTAIPPTKKGEIGKIKKQQRRPK